MKIIKYIFTILVFLLTVSFMFAIPTDEIETPYNWDYLYIEMPYPIPAVSEVNINVWWDPKYEFKTTNVTVYDTKGNKIDTHKKLKIGKNGSWYGTLTWNTSEVNPGVYIIIIKHGSIEKLVKILVG